MQLYFALIACVDLHGLESKVSVQPVWRIIFTAPVWPHAFACWLATVHKVELFLEWGEHQVKSASGNVSYVNGYTKIT